MEAGYPPPLLVPGMRVVLQGLSASELNGLTGRLQSFHADRGRWAVSLSGTQKLLKAANLQAVEECAFHINIVTEILSEDLFLRVCNFLPAPTLLAVSTCSKSTRHQTMESSESHSLWRSLCYEMLGACLISLHIASWADSQWDKVHRDVSFWKVLFESAYVCEGFFYDHGLREKCLQRSDFFEQAVISKRKDSGERERSVMMVSGDVFEKKKQETLSSSGHTACAMGSSVFMIGGWRPWSAVEDLHVCMVDFPSLSISEPPLAEGSYRPSRRLRHSSCLVRPPSGEAILVLGGCNDRTHEPCDGLETLLLLRKSSDDPTKISWTKLSATGQMPKAIWHHSADSFAAGRRVVVFGGDIPTRDPEFTYIGDRAYANYVYILSVDLQQWDRVQTDGQVPSWRSLHTAVTFTSFENSCEHLVTMGGCEERLEIFHSGKPAKMVGYSLNLKTMKWKRGLERKKQSDGREVYLPAPRMRFAAQRYGRHLLVYGGHGTGMIPADEERLGTRN